MNKIPSYSSLVSYSHKMAQGFFDNSPIVVEEKIDGSQISFTMTTEGKLLMKSKNCDLNEGVDSQFRAGVDYIISIPEKLKPGYIYRGEYLARLRHNALTYERTPINNIVIFDIDRGDQDYMGWEERADEANQIGLESVRVYGVVEFDSMMHANIQDWLKMQSMLGAPAVEGVVFKRVKNDMFTSDKKSIVVKLVSDAFREVNKTAHAKTTRNDIIQSIVNTYRTETRWMKAVQHLRDAGELANEARDIGLLIREIQADVFRECEDEMKELLFSQFRKEISSGLVRGFPEFYKSEVL